MASFQLNIRYKANDELETKQHLFQVDPALKVCDITAQAVAFWQLEAGAVRHYLFNGKVYMSPGQQLSTLVGMGKLRSGDTVRLTCRTNTTIQQQRPVTATAQHAATRRAVARSNEETIDQVVQVQNQVIALDGKADILVAAARGQTPARGSGQTDAQRIAQIRLAKRTMDNELQLLVERETDRKATKRRATLAGITSTAEIANGWQ